MSLLKQIDDKGAVLEWSPIAEHPNVVALGTKDSAGVGFDDFGGELELHRLDFTDMSRDTVVLGKARASTRFASIAWSQMAISSADYPYGLIAGGMVDGTINVWNAGRLAAGEGESLMASVEQHQGSVNTLHFNPHKESSHLLASGGSDAEVYVTSLEHPDAPSVFIPAPPPNNSKHTADITKVAWNTQVAHILASASQNGSCFIWDLRQKKAWCELRDPAGGPVSDVAWNPDQGLHLVTASGDDKNPVLKLWDLRSSTSLPLATLQGHTEGILSISWCPSDPSLLMSCGKDNKTMLWDLFHLQPVFDLPSGRDSSGGKGKDEPADPGMFGGLATTAGHRRHHVAWSPCMPAIVSASTFDRRVQFFSVTGARSKLGRAPKWLRKPVGIAFGFGGKLARFGNQAATASGATAEQKAAGTSGIDIFQVVEDPPFVEASDKFHAAIERDEYKEYCEFKSASADCSAHEQQVWALMKVICFGANAREELLAHLGFDSAAIAEIGSDYLNGSGGGGGSSSASTPAGSAKSPVGTILDDSVKAEDVFGKSASIAASEPVASAVEVVVETKAGKKVDLAALSDAEATKAKELYATCIAGEEAEPNIRKAIIVGNFEVAVEHCLKAGLMAEALLLAQCGDQALRVKTQAAFFEAEKHKHPFLNVLHAVIKSELMEYVLASDLTKWQETLALLSTYGKSDEFASLCEALGERLETERQDTESCTLCYMCAANVTRTLEFWTANLKAANAVVGHINTKALQNYVEKVMVFTHANPSDDLGSECSEYFAKYAEMLASQGRLDVALRYLSASTVPDSVLIDRLYHSTKTGGGSTAGQQAPAFPFERVNVISGVHQPAQPRQTNAAAESSAPQLAERQLSKSNSGSRSFVGKSAAERSVASATKAAAQPTSISSATAAPSVATATAAAVSGGLPAGWIQLVDQTSGHTYYVNQSTGQSQWEPPVLPTPSTATGFGAPAPAISSSVSIDHSQQVQQQQLVQQVQVQTESAVPASQSVDISMAGMNLDDPAGAGSSQVPDVECIDVLGQYIEALAGYLTTPAEKKQLVMIRQSFKSLQDKMRTNGITSDVLQKLSLFADCLLNRNFAGATAIQTDLANTVWTQHKDWLKGIKLITQLASKK